MRKRQILAFFVGAALLLQGGSAGYGTAYASDIYDAEAEYEEAFEAPDEEFSEYAEEAEELPIEAEDDDAPVFFEGASEDVFWETGEAVETGEEEDGDFSDEVEGEFDTEIDLTGDASAEAVAAESEEAAAYEEAYEIVSAEAEAEAAAVLGSYAANTKQNRESMSYVNIGEELALSGDPKSFADEEGVLVGAGSLPEAFDLREITRPAPDQGRNGSCWAYATTAAVEVSAVTGAGASAAQIDDSETYLAWFGHALRNGEGPLEYEKPVTKGTLANPFRAGGTAEEAASLLTSYFGPARESALPQMPTTTTAMEQAVTSSAYTGLNWQNSGYYADHAVTDVDFLPEVNRYSGSTWLGHDANAVEAIKTALFEGRAVTTDILAPQNNEYVSNEFNSLYVCDEDQGSSHQVVIVGWDDTFPADHFTTVAEGDGAWLCRNSWGTYESSYRSRCETTVKSSLATWKNAYLAEDEHAGMSASSVTVDMLARWCFEQDYPFDEYGYFYISYYDRVYHSPTAYHVVSRSEVSDETLLLYDYLGMAKCTTPAVSEASGCEANVFSLPKAQDLTRIAVYTREAASHVKAEIYLLYADAKGPTDGVKLYTKETTCRWAGYHILNVDQRVTLPAGGKFSVVVTIKGSTGNAYTPYEYSAVYAFEPQYVYRTAPNVPGQSYILTSSGWTDMANYQMNGYQFGGLSGVTAGNAMIRAFTGTATGTATPVPARPVVIPSSVTKATYAPLLLRGSSPSKTSVKLKWQKQSGASGYTIYGAKYGKKAVKIRDIAAPAAAATLKKLKKNTYYKYYVEAYRMYGTTRVVTAKSAVIYVATAGGKYTNYKSVKLTTKKSLSVKKKKTSQIRAAGVSANKKRKILVRKKLRYESTNSSVASVSKTGKITAKKKGTAVIYVYAQNGVSASVKVKVT